jgi:hypothetical protein
MSRKLIHSVRALAVSLGLLTLGLIAAVPLASTTGGLPVTAEDSAEARVESGEQRRTTRPHSRQRRAMARESMALPFFSFAQGLRSGNGS